MKKSGKDRLKCAVYESTRAPRRGPPSPMGKAKRRGLRRPQRKPTPPRCARQPLSREGARVDTPSFLWKEVPRRGGGWGGKSGMKKSEGDRLKCVVYESTLSTATRSPFPNGEGKEEGLRRPKRKPTPPRCARQPLPREGARVDTPFFLWKEVPRRGGGWMGKAG